MRVPTYTRKTRATAKTGATAFSVRANPGALSAGTQGLADAFSAAEGAAIRWYETEQKIKRRESLSQNEEELSNRLDKLKNEQRTRSPGNVLDGDPDTDEESFSEISANIVGEMLSRIDDKKVRQQFGVMARQMVNRAQISVNQDARNRLIDQRLATELRKAKRLEHILTTGNRSERKQASLELFGGVDDDGGEIPGIFKKMADEGLVKQSKAVELRDKTRKEILDLQNEHEATLLENNTHQLVLRVSNIDLPLEVRLNDLNSVAEEYGTAAQRGIISSEKAHDEVNKALNDMARGTALQMMAQSSDAMSVAMNVVSAGGSADPVLQTLMVGMLPEARMKLGNSLLRIATKMDTERRRKEEADEKAADEANKDRYQAIINLTTNNPKDPAYETAKENYDILRRLNWFSPTTLAHAEAALGLGEAPEVGEVPKTSSQAMQEIDEADIYNTLTLKLIRDLSPYLSTAQRRDALQRFSAERIDGVKEGKQLMANFLGLSQFTGDNNGLPNVGRSIYARSLLKFQQWLNTDRDDKELARLNKKGGRGASYQEIIQKANDINTENDKEFKDLMADQAIRYIAQRQRMGFLPDFTMDTTLSPVDQIEATLKYLAGKNINDPANVNMTRQLKNYLSRLGVRKN